MVYFTVRIRHVPTNSERLLSVHLVVWHFWVCGAAVHVGCTNVFGTLTSLETLGSDTAEPHSRSILPVLICFPLYWHTHCVWCLRMCIVYSMTASCSFDGLTFKVFLNVFLILTLFRWIVGKCFYLKPVSCLSILIILHEHFSWYDSPICHFWVFCALRVHQESLYFHQRLMFPVFL